VCCCVLLALITLLQYHEVLTLPTLKSVTDTDVDRITGEITTFGRLQGSGIFNDPNELGVMLATAVPVALYLLADPKSVLRFVFVLPLGIFFYAVYLTQSRGAFLALVAGLGGWALARFGGRRAVGFALVGLPVLLVFFAGRQTSLSASQGTGQTRIQIWSDWLTEFRESPLFGKGMSLSEEDPDAIKERMEWEGKKHVAHNSYLHSFRDLGLVGGMLFLGAFLLAFWSLARLSPGQAQVLDPEMARLRPFLLGALAAFALGILSLSLCYSIPTYMVLGLVTAYGRVTPCRAVKPALSWDLNIAGRIALAGVGFLAFTYMIVRVFGGSG